MIFSETGFVPINMHIILYCNNVILINEALFVFCNPVKIARKFILFLLIYDFFLNNRRKDESFFSLLLLKKTIDTEGCC